MSSSFQEMITCPKCNQASQFTIWRSINTSLDPEMKASVRDGSAFLFTCPHCREITHVEYGFLYHQMEDEIMIQIAASEEAVQEALEMLSGNQLSDMLKDFQVETHYLTRIVRSQNELREKLAILDNGLDDRIMELYKVFLLAHYQEKNPDAKNVTLLYFHGDDDNQRVQIFVNDHPAGAFDFSTAMYQQVSVSFRPFMKDIRDQEPIVDRQWAVQFLNSHAKTRKV